MGFGLSVLQGPFFAGVFQLVLECESARYLKYCHEM
jgi:hypothetical protein